MKKFLIVILCLLIPSLALAAPAQNPLSVCLTKSGSIQAKPKCSKSESVLNSSALKKLVTTEVQGQPAGNGSKGEKGDPGAQGTQGVPGNPGAQGPKGDAGISALSTLPSGATMRGAIGSASVVLTVGSAFASFSVQAPQPPSAVLVAPTPQFRASCPNILQCLVEDGPGGESEVERNARLCSGTTENPTAPPGIVCVYPTAAVEPGSIRGKAIGIYGFRLDWEPIMQESFFRNRFTSIEGVWAYTAP